MKQVNPRDFYRSYEWEKVRAKVLERDRYECQICKSRGRYREGNLVHHIKYLRDRPDLALNPDNLVTVCRECHAEIHNPEIFGTKQDSLENRFPERW